MNFLIFNTRLSYQKLSRVFLCYNIVMKKILGIILGLIILQNVCFAQTNVSFVYINGSNNNDAKMRNWYINGVGKLHPVMKKKFEKNKEIKKVFSDKPQYKINDNPVIFFWGDKSKKDLEFVQEQLDITKASNNCVQSSLNVDSIFA